MKEILIDVLETIKDFWVYSGVEDFDYRIEERYDDIEKTFWIRIYIGRNSNVQIVRVSEFYPKHKKSPANQDEVNNLREICYKKILRTLCLGGIDKAYKDAILFYRESGIPDLRQVGQNPLTPKECSQTKSKHNEKTKTCY